MDNTLQFKFSYSNGRELILNNSKEVFIPTGTTEALVNAVDKHLKSPCKVLDIGCGSGATGIALHQLGWVKEPLYASDISEIATRYARMNAKAYNCKVIARDGSMFDPWENEKFDAIVNDISGVAQPVADISPWFKGVSCESGPDGTKLIISVLKKAGEHLCPNGMFFFPVLSLSNTDKIIATAKKAFDTVELLSKNEWPLPKEMYKYKKELDVLMEEGKIYYNTKFGMIIWYTDIYVAYNKN